MMKITLLYDNTTCNERLISDWGFSCLVESDGKSILFDTGADGSILLYNMKKLGIDPGIVDEVFISHDHWDHTGGLHEFLDINQVNVYIPPSCSKPPEAESCSVVNGPGKISENIFSTGELGNFEQSLVIETEKGLVVIVGCAHPGIGPILESASHFGRPHALIGGFHDFCDFSMLSGLDIVCPTHCSVYADEIRKKYSESYLPGGAGRVIVIE